MTLQEAVNAVSALVDLDLDLNIGLEPGDTGYDQAVCDVLSASATRVYQEVDYEYQTVTFDPVAGDQSFAMQDDTLSGSPAISVNLFTVEECRIANVPITVLPWRTFNDPSNFGLTWRTASNGSPVACTVTPELNLVFNCPFSIGAIATGGFGLSGLGSPRRFDASLVASEWSECHRLLQWAVIREAIPYGTDGNIDSPQALSRLQLYDRLASADKKRFLSLVSHHNSPLDDMPTTFGDVWL